MKTGLLHQRRILVVAPSQSSSAEGRLCIDLLRDAGAEVFAGSAEANVLLQLDRQAPHLFVIVSDAEGTEVRDHVRLLRADPSNTDLPILVITDTPELRLEIGVDLWPLQWLPMVALEDPTMLTTAAHRMAESRFRVTHLTDLLEGAETERSKLASKMETGRRGIEELEHEVKTPLGVIVGFGANLRDGLLGPLMLEQAEAIEKMLTGAQRISEVVGGTLDRLAPDVLAASEAPIVAPRKLRRTQVELTSLVRELVDFMAEQAKRKHIVISFDAPFPVLAWSDANAVRQAVLNLLSNAIKFTPEGGVVQVRVRELPSDFSDPKPLRHRACARVIVEDSGTGIPDAERERIFERGVRLPSHSTVPGTGLGLSIGREVAQAHRGELTVGQSKLKGARFEFVIPVDVRSRPRRPLVLLQGNPSQADALQTLLDDLVSHSAQQTAHTVKGDESLHALLSASAVVLLPENDSWNALLSALRAPNSGLKALPASGGHR